MILIQILGENISSTNEKEYYNRYRPNGKLIGQNYQRDNGDWMHKWKSINHEGFDKFSWNGKAKGNDMETWTYEIFSANGNDNYL